MQKKKTKKENPTDTWKALKKTAKEDKFSILIDNSIIIRRVPFNYEVIEKNNVNHPCYYGRLEEAFRKVVDYMVDGIAKPHTAPGEVLEELHKIYAKIDRLIAKYGDQVRIYKRPKRGKKNVKEEI